MKKLVVKIELTVPDDAQNQHIVESFDNHLGEIVDDIFIDSAEDNDDWQEDYKWKVQVVDS